MPQRNLLTTNRFALEIDRILNSAYNSFKFPESTVTNIQYRNGNDPPVMQNFGGLHTLGPATLSTGLTFNEAATLELANWHKDAVEGRRDKALRNVRVIMLNNEGVEVLSFNIRDAFPTKLSLSPLESKNNEIASVSIEMSCTEINWNTS
jgi:phage tail-like protein